MRDYPLQQFEPRFASRANLRNPSFVGLLWPACILMLILCVTLVHADEWDEKYEVGKQQVERGQWQIGLTNIQAALQIQPQPDHQAATSNLKLVEYLPYYFLGKAYLMLGDYEAALSNFRASISAGAVLRTEHQSTVRRMLSITETLLEYQTESETRASTNGDLEIGISRVQQMLAEERFEQASQILQQLRRDDVEDNRLRVLENWLQQERQRAALRAEQENGTSTAQLKLQQGLDYFLRGQYVLAEDAFRQAESLDPNLSVARSWRQKAESEMERLRLDRMEAQELEPVPEPEIIERIVTQTTAPVILLRSPHQVVTETREERLLLSGRAGDDQGISRVEITINGKPLVDAGGEPVVIRPQAAEDASRFTFEAELPLRMGENQIIITAYDIDSPPHRTSEQYSVTRKPPMYRTETFAISLAAFAFLAVGGVVISRIIKYRIAIVSKYNPYIAGAPIRNEEMFFGREALLKRILNTIHNNSLMIYGPRRIGKTSLQHQLKRRLEQMSDPEYEFIPVMVDLQGTSEEQFFITLMEEVVESCKKRLNGEHSFRVHKHNANYSGRDLSRDLKTLLKVLVKTTNKKLKLVLLIDEVDELNKYSEQANQRLRSVFMKTWT